MEACIGDAPDEGGEKLLTATTQRTGGDAQGYMRKEEEPYPSGHEPDTSAQAGNEQQTPVSVRLVHRSGRDQLVQDLAEQGVGTLVHRHPVRRLAGDPGGRVTMLSPDRVRGHQVVAERRRFEDQTYRVLLTLQQHETTKQVQRSEETVIHSSREFDVRSAERFGPKARAPIDIEQLTDQVVRQIDNRIVAHRERLGKVF